jgi:hypothetical protein
MPYPVANQEWQGRDGNRGLPHGQPLLPGLGSPQAEDSHSSWTKTGEHRPPSLPLIGSGPDPGVQPNRGQIITERVMLYGGETYMVIKHHSHAAL